MRLLLIACIATTSTSMMAMKEWDAALNSSGGNVWFKAPALDAVVHGASYDGDAATIMQGVARLFDTLAQHGTGKDAISLSYIGSLCENSDAHIICPRVKVAYKAFMSKKDSASADEALKLLSVVIEEMFAPNIIPLTAADDFSDYIASMEQQLIAYKQQEEETLAAYKQAKEGCEGISCNLTDQTKSIEDALAKVRALQAKKVWTIKDCQAIEWLKYSTGYIKRTMDRNTSTLPTIKKRVDAYKQLDIKMRAQDGNKRIVEIISITALVVASCYAILRSIKKDQNEQSHRSAR